MSEHPKANSTTLAQSSSKLDTDQGDLIEETIKHMAHKLHQTILTSDISTNNSERTTSVGNTKIINTPNVIDIQTPAITDNLIQDKTTAFQLPRNASLHPTYADSNKNATCVKVNQPTKENTTPALTTFEQTKQIIMDIDAISH